MASSLIRPCRASLYIPQGPREILFSTEFQAVQMLCPACIINVYNLSCLNNFFRNIYIISINSVLISYAEPFLFSCECFPLDINM
jgi:hypothetical protein